MDQVRRARDMRRHGRNDSVGRIRIIWEDSDGEPRFCEAPCLDVSPNGLRLQLPVAVPLRAVVHLRALETRLETAATVRYCRRVGLKYVLGLEFSNGFQYVPGTPAPRWD